MQEFFKMLETLTTEQIDEFYTRIGQAADTLPPFGTIEYNRAVKALLEKYMQER